MLFKKIGDFPNDSVQGPLEIYGGAKGTPPRFGMGEQLYPLFRRPCVQTVFNHPKIVLTTVASEQ